jgi:hypothetical protein
MNEQDIWSAFIDRELRLYAEPQRLGTPRGSPIGQSLKKYHAKLLRHSGKLLKEIASEVGVNPGTVRNWNMEDEFNSFSEKDARSFVDFYISQITSGIITAGQEEQDSEIFKKGKELMVYCLRKLKIKGELRKDRKRTLLAEMKKSLIELAISILINSALIQNPRKEVFVLLCFYRDFLS